MIEANMVAKEIRKKVNAGDYKYSDFACLYRTNAQSRTLEEKLLWQMFLIRLSADRISISVKKLKTFCVI